MISIPKIKFTIPAIIAVSILSIALISYSPMDVSAELDKFSIPEISGTIAVSDELQNYSDYASISLSDAMQVAENSVTDGKAMWGKLDVVQEFLVYKVGVLTSDNIFHMVVVDAGDASPLYVSEGVSKDNWKQYKHSDSESHKKWKDHYADLTPEERELKKQQWSEVKDAFFALSIDERAKMIMHFMSMKAQWDSLSDEEIEDKKLEMKSMMEELLPLSVEEKTQKLREYLNSI
ncbi:MAG: hypothetical protein H2B00_07210 [Nitrosopumilaceae archaeon]|jgi:hypothetical protein|uniref:Uncharacterized protein n=1 Tax=Candidatus Nitrosomaritimum aestuariumsis TaxID=3342354 RepID=A0AC60VZW0_9ARCH|nr:hypothetical protein [Nitrosopumilaceae archaeon]MBA4460646.1 hypothetical protein [Nitrosopumilaceae archaeon]MBA4462286.1 hypothetical protein [Nitrosopumilaceae archaeon]NCF21856.1 hypothetical protein [Nitrosopumilaceae archaeon]